MGAATQPAVLTIAGADSGGGAGIQADLRAFAAHDCYGASVVVALTAQNSKGVQAVYPSPPVFIEKQLGSVLDDIDIKAIKTGMLFDAASIRTVARVLESHYAEGTGRSLPPLVCDPVCVSTSGHNLLRPDALHVLVSELLPLTFLLTPNESEAELILATKGIHTSEITDLDSMLDAAQALSMLGPKNVLVQGGRLLVSLDDVSRLRAVRPDLRVVRSGLYDENMEILRVAEDIPEIRNIVADVLQTSYGQTLFLRAGMHSTGIHGTRCTLSAVLACELSRGKSVQDAITIAVDYTHVGVDAALPIGEGPASLVYSRSLSTRSVPQPTSSDPYPFVRMLIRSTAYQWKEYVEHDFVKQLALGTLPRECFVHFVKQGTLYLKYYARAHGLLAAKSSSFSAIQSAAKVMMDCVTEVAPSNTSRARWGVTEAEILSTPESTATVAYGAYLMDCGLRGDAIALIMAVAACLLGYGEVGLWFKKERRKPNTWVVIDGNPYAQWLDEYGGEQYQNAVRTGIIMMESIAAADPPSPARLEEWRCIWERCTRMEKGFWDMALTRT